MAKNKGKVTPHNIVHGICGEKPIVHMIKCMIGKTRFRKGWFYIKHNSWGRHYCHGHGTDITVFDKDHDSIIDIEIKNWKEQPRNYGIETAQNEIIDRFRDSTAKIKLLIISYISLLTYKARDLIENAGIKIMELGNFIEPNDSWGYILKTFRQTFWENGTTNYQNIKKFLGIFRSQLNNNPVLCKVKLITTHLTSYINSNKLTNTYNLNNITTNITNYDTTPVNDGETDGKPVLAVGYG